MDRNPYTSKELQVALGVLACPRCGDELQSADERVSCRRSSDHRFPIVDGYVELATPDPGKYDDAYARRYAALWSYASETIHRGHGEGLYRTIASLTLEALGDQLPNHAGGDDTAVIIDAGCGTGRTLVDAATLAPHAVVLGLDASPAMLSLAARIAHGSDDVDLSGVLRDAGFAAATIRGRALGNVFLARADAQRLPVRDLSADVVVSVNLIDRLGGGPAGALSESRRVLRRGGSLVIADPLNWSRDDDWLTYPSAGHIRQMIVDHGFEIETWFDDLPYRELLDARGSTREYRTLVVRARKR